MAVEARPAGEWTGERYLPHVDPTICGAEIHYEHLHRYAFASEFVRGRSVLDLASGEGYGSYMLSKVAGRVTGIELDRDTIDHAVRKYAGDNIEFRQGSILDVPIEGRALYDVIVCFEAIEHVADHEKLLAEVKRLLKPGGTFIASTPNKPVYNEDGRPNPFHVRELELAEFRGLLDGKFTHTVLFGQKVVTGSSIWPLAGESEPGGFYRYAIGRDTAGFRLQKGIDRAPKYYIAVSSDNGLEYLGRAESMLVDESNAGIKQLLSQFNEMQSALAAITGSLEWRLVTKAHALIRSVLPGRAEK